MPSSVCQNILRRRLQVRHQWPCHPPTRAPCVTQTRGQNQVTRRRNLRFKLGRHRTKRSRRQLRRQGRLVGPSGDIDAAPPRLAASHRRQTKQRGAKGKAKKHCRAPAILKRQAAVSTVAQLKLASASMRSTALEMLWEAGSSSLANSQHQSCGLD